MTFEITTENYLYHYDDLTHTPNLNQDLFNWARYFLNLLQNQFSHLNLLSQYLVFQNPNFSVYLTSTGNFIIQKNDTFFNIRTPDSFNETISNQEINQIHSHLLNQASFTQLLSVIRITLGGYHNGIN